MYIFNGALARAGSALREPEIYLRNYEAGRRICLCFHLADLHARPGCNANNRPVALRNLLERGCSTTIRTAVANFATATLAEHPSDVKYAATVAEHTAIAQPIALTGAARSKYQFAANHFAARSNPALAVAAHAAKAAAVPIAAPR